MKKDLQKVSKWVTLFRGWRIFGGSWDTFGALSRFGLQKCVHSAPKVLPGIENYLQNDLKSVKTDPESASESEFIGDSYIEQKTTRNQHQPETKTDPKPKPARTKTSLTPKPTWHQNQLHSRTNPKLKPTRNQNRPETETNPT